MKKIFFLISFFTVLAYAQSFSIKQITNLNADCRNLSGGSFYYGLSYYVFEAHIGNSSSIYLGQYIWFYPDIDTFAVIKRVTDNNYMNINPQLISSNDSLFIIYQTNKNGNWDIAYQVYKNNQLSPVYFAADSSADEINPVVSYVQEGSFSSPIQFVSYEKRNSVYIKNIHNPGLPETEIFHVDDSTKYSQVSLDNSNYFLDYLVAARKIVNGKSSIVYKEFSSDIWGNENVLVNSGNCRNPKIQEINWRTGLSYTDDINGKSNIILIEEFKQVDTLKLFGYPLYNYNNFWTFQPIIISSRQDFYNYVPYTCSASNNDSLFIRVNKDEFGWNHSDTLIYTTVKNSTLHLGSMGMYSLGSVFYTFWEDSINGKIQIFGRRDIEPIGSVNDKYSPSEFTLNQNYPNPFNPATVINFNLLHRGKVTLNVYDIMGRQICTLLNEDKPTGNYTIYFDSKKFNLSSGVYFYRLVTGKNSAVKKMILLK